MHKRLLLLALLALVVVGGVLMEIRLNGVQFPVASDRQGVPQWKRDMRPSQPGDPGDLVVAEWQTWGPDFNSFEAIPPGGQAGFLGRDYGQNTDGRWEGIDQLGPQINTITLSTHDTDTDVVQDARAQTEVEAWATKYAYIARGTRPAKVDLSDMTLKNGGARLDLPITDLVTTVAASDQAVLTVVAHLTDATNLLDPTRTAPSLDGNYVYVNSFDQDRMTVVDVSDPQNPFVTGSVTDADMDQPSGIAASIDGNYVYVTALNTNRLLVIDVSDPSSPTIVGNLQDNTNLNMPNSVRAAANGTYVYVASFGTDRLTVVDVSTPASPSVTGSVSDATNLDGILDLRVHPGGTHVIVTAFNADRVTTVDVSTPATPTVDGSVTDTDLDGANGIDISADGDTVYVAAQEADRLTVVDVSTLGSPSVTGSVQDTTNLATAVNVAVSGDGTHVYVTPFAADRVTVVRVSTPASPVVVSTVLDDLTSTTRGISVSPDGEFAYVGLQDDGSLLVLALITYEVCAGQGDGAAYEVLQAVSIGNPAESGSDTWVANDAAHAARSFGIAPDRIVAMAGNVVKGNILTGSITMESPNWNTVATIEGRARNVRLNGFALDGPLWVISSSVGPYMLDRDTLDFFPLIPEIDHHTANGRNAGNWSFLGAVIPLQRTLRFQRNLSNQSFGPEVSEGNTSPVQGHTHGFAGSERWGYAAFHNVTTGDSYLAACRPRQPGDPHLHPVSWFTLAKFTSVHCEYLRYIGTADGLRTNPTVMGGYDDDCFWLLEGRTAREIDDENYQNATAGTSFLTELRRQPGVLKDIEAVEFESANCDADNTIIVAVSLDGGTAQVFSTVTTDGHQRLYAASGGVPTSAFHGGRRLKPEIRYVADAVTNLVTNGGFESNTTGWQTAFLGTNEFLRSMEQARFGSASAKATYQDSLPLADSPSVTLTAARYTFSAWVYVPTAWDGGAPQLQAVGFTGSSTVDDSDATADLDLRDQWQRLVLVVDIDAGDLTGWLRVAAGSAPTAGRFIYVDGAQVELGSAATPYIETNGAAFTAATASPQVVGTLRLFYRIRPLTVRVYEYSLDLRPTASRSAEELEEALDALLDGSGPVKLEDHDRDTVYVRAERVSAQGSYEATGGSASGGDSGRRAVVRLTEWGVSA